MDRGALRSFVARTQALVEPAPPATLEETRTWIVEPLLATLGWDVRADSNACEMETNRSLEGVSLEYVLSIDDTPGLFVAVESFTDDLSDRRERDLRRVMQASGVDRTIYTNGRAVVLLAGPGGRDRFQCPLSSLQDAESELEHVSFRRTRRRLERHSRAFATRRLAVERTALTDSIVDELAAIAGESYRTELRTVTERFVDRLVDEFTTSSASGSGTDALDRGYSRDYDHNTDRNRDQEPTTDHRDSVTLERDPSDVTASDRDGELGQRFDRDAEPGADPDGGAAPDSTADDETNSDPMALESADPDSSSDSETDSGSDLDSETDPDPDSDSDDPNSSEGTTEPDTTDTDDSEYVVRFFNDRGSIGAIGHSQPEQAMVYAAEYLFDRGLGDLSVPWGPADDATVLNDAPVLEDGTAMPSAETLSNGCVLNTGGTLEVKARRLEALTEEAGLRAMLTGDWPSA